MGTIWVQHMRPPSELSLEELASIRENHVEDLGAPEWHVFDSEERYLGVVTMPEQFTPRWFPGRWYTPENRSRLDGSLAPEHRGRLS